MKYGLEIADAWLYSLSSAWKRAGLYWLFVALVSWASLSIFGGESWERAIEPVLLLGGITFVIAGPVAFWSVLVAAVTWIRFVHLETAGMRSFLLLACLISINAWLGEDHLSIWQLVLAQVGAIGLIGLTVVWAKEDGGIGPEVDVDTATPNNEGGCDGEKPRS